MTPDPAYSPLCYGLGYLTGVIAFGLMARRRGLATEGIFLLMGAGLLGGLGGAGLLQRWVGGTDGKTVLGGIVVGYACVALAKRLLGIRRPTGDLFAVAISAGEAVGRWGCFFGGCCFGVPAPGLPWAIQQHDAWRHPTQAYLSLANLLILAVLLKIERSRPAENTLFLTQGVLYCLARFVIEFWRAHPGPAPALGLSAAQWACLAGCAAFGAALARLRRPITRRGYA